MISFSISKHKNKRFLINESKEPITYTGEESSSTDLIDEITEQLQKIQTAPKRANRPLSQPQDNSTPDTATLNLISDIVPIMDSIERTLELADTFSDNEILKNWLTNVAAVYRKLRNVLFRHGLQEMENIGKIVDFNRHEVVEYRETNNFPENTIIEEKQKGYLFQNKVIRDAKVIVAKHAIKT